LFSDLLDIHQHDRFGPADNDTSSGLAHVTL
jgi:hypothetical protein